MKKSSPLLCLLLPVALLLNGCDQLSSTLGVETPAQKEAKNDSEGRAVGSACRHSGRAIEDCYSIYAWLPKSSIYAGWREMDEYMRENKIAGMPPKASPMIEEMADGTPAPAAASGGANSGGAIRPASAGQRPILPAGTPRPATRS